MKRLISIALTAFLCLNLHAQKTDTISENDYTYSKVLALAKFHDLKYLKLYAYKDSILPEIFDQFPKLEYLEISSSYIRQIPRSIGSLSNLKTLIISGWWKPIIIPAELGKLTQLTRLRIYDHKFETVPAEIGNLINLEDIMLCGDLTDLPASVANWKKLKSLYLDGNKFRKIPAPVFQLTQLKYLDLGRNELSVLNDSIRVLKELKELVLNGNIELEQLPLHFCELKKLKELDLLNTKINTLPTCLNQLDSLKRIRMCKTVIDDPETLEAAFRKKIEWDWRCWGLERHLVDFNELYGTYSLKLKNKKDTLILNYGYSYNQPGTIDDEYSRNITIKILQKDSLRLNQIYTASNPHFILSSNHFSVWDWETSKNQEISGYISFREISEKEVTVYLNLDLIENGEKRKLVDKFLTFE